MRPQALTRKNALVAGHDDGAENWGILAALIVVEKASEAIPVPQPVANDLGRLGCTDKEQRS